MRNVSPRAEPITWSLVTSTAVAAALSYGLNITSELGNLLVMVCPFILTGLVARFNVFAPDTVEDNFIPIDDFVEAVGV